MIEKRAVAPFHDGHQQRITLLAPKGRNLNKLASVMPEVERFAAALTGEDGAHWIHVIALTASEYYGNNRNGDHWSIEALSHFPPGWTGEPAVDRELSKTYPYGSGTFYGAHAFPHHANKAPDTAIGRVELVVWNPHQFWTELVMRLDIERTAQSKVKWVLDRIKRGAPFDVSMGAKVPFDMATIGDVKAYRQAQKDFDPSIHRSPADAVLAAHKRLKAVDGRGIYGLSITRDDYIPECKTELGKVYADGRQVGVRNDYPKFFDISIVYVGADKVAKFIKKLASDLISIRDSMLRRSDPQAYRIEQGFRMAKAASMKGAAVGKEGDIDKETGPAFDEKSIRILSSNDPDLPEPVLRYLKEHPNFDRVLSTLSVLGIVLKPKEYEIISGGRDAGVVDDRLFTPEVAARLTGVMRRRSVLGPVAENRLATLRHASLKQEQVGSDDRYKSYRQRIMSVLGGGPERVFEKNQDLWPMLGHQARNLVSPLTRRFFSEAYLAGGLDNAQGSDVP